MVKPRKKITIILGLNFATVFVPWLCCCFELMVVIFTVISYIYNGRWDKWDHCFYLFCALLIIWVFCLIIALLVCRKRLVIEGKMLRIKKGREVLYQCDVSEIYAVKRERFSPFSSEPGSIIIVNYLHPVPKSFLLLMSWFSYKRVSNYIKNYKKQ